MANEKTLSLSSSPAAPRLRIVEVEQANSVHEGPVIRFPDDAVAAARSLIASKDREHFVVFHLDGAHRIVSAETVSVGTLNEAPAHPREIFKSAILQNAHAIICAHNHPSGGLDPSMQDRATFDRLREAGK